MAKIAIVRTIAVFVLVFYFSCCYTGMIGTEIVADHSSCLSQAEAKQRPLKLSADNHSPIFIAGNADLQSFIAGKGWAGNGSQAAPFIIEMLDIESNGTSCIDIHNTSLYLELKNCILTGATDPLAAGIRLYNVSNCNVDSCIMLGNARGLLMESCRAINVSNTQAHGSFLSGFTLRHTFDVILMGNNCSENELDGYYMESCSKLLLSNSIAIANHHCGVRFTQSSFLNELHNFSSTRNSGSGVLIEDSSSTTIIEGSAVIENFGSGVVFDASSGNRLNGSVIADNLGAGVRVLDGGSNNIIGNCTINENANGGIRISNSGQNHINDNVIIDNFEGGVTIDNWSSQNNVSENRIESNEAGLRLLDGVRNTVVLGNTFSVNVEYGIIIENSILNIFVDNWLAEPGSVPARDDGHNNTWDDGVSKGNYWDHLDPSGLYNISGIAGSIDHFPTLDDVIAPMLKHLPDIIVEEGEKITLEWNAFDLNPYSYEVLLDGSMLFGGAWNGSSISIISWNMQIGQFNYTVIVKDIVGQTNSDIVIVNYTVDTRPPEVYGPSDIAFVHLTDAPTISWLAQDLNPATYRILLNGTQITSGTWNSTTQVSFHLQNLWPGVYNITIIFEDTRGNSVVQFVIVTVHANVLAATGIGLVVVFLPILAFYMVRGKLKHAVHHKRGHEKHEKETKAALLYRV